MLKSAWLYVFVYLIPVSSSHTKEREKPLMQIVLSYIGLQINLYLWIPIFQFNS